MKSVIVIGRGFWRGSPPPTALRKKGPRDGFWKGVRSLGGRAYSFVDPAMGDSRSMNRSIIL